MVTNRLACGPGAIYIKTVTDGDFQVVWRDGKPFHRDTGEALSVLDLQEFIMKNKTPNSQPEVERIDSFKWKPFTMKDLRGFSVKLKNRGKPWDGCNGSDELIIHFNTRVAPLMAALKVAMEALDEISLKAAANSNAPEVPALLSMEDWARLFQDAQEGICDEARKALAEINRIATEAE